MEHLMIHENGVNTCTVSPDKRKRLLATGKWREYTEAPVEVIQFQETLKKNPIKEFIGSKQAEQAEPTFDIPGVDEVIPSPVKPVRKGGRPVTKKR